MVPHDYAYERASATLIDEVNFSRTEIMIIEMDEQKQNYAAMSGGYMV